MPSKTPSVGVLLINGTSLDTNGDSPPTKATSRGGLTYTKLVSNPAAAIRSISSSDLVRKPGANKLIGATPMDFSAA